MAVGDGGEGEVFLARFGYVYDSAMGTLVVVGELWREGRRRVGKPTYKFGECLRFFGGSCSGVGGGEGVGGGD